MSDLAYSPLEQFQIYSILLYRDGWAEKDKFEIKEVMYELCIYEDIYSPSYSASLTIVDPFNIVDSFPIVGGEKIDVLFKTPSSKTIEKLEMTIAKVSDRTRTMDAAKVQMVTLELVTNESYTSTSVDLAGFFEGTYSDIVKAILGKVSKRPVETDQSIYNQTYIATNWSALKCCKMIADRAMGDKFEPFMFFDTIGGYKFKSALKMFKAEPYAKYRIEPGAVMPDAQGFRPDTFRKVLKYEYKESLDKMRQNSSGGFGATVTILDPVTTRFVDQEVSYKDMSRSKDFAMIGSYPLFDDALSRNKCEFSLAASDNSHQGYHYRNMLKTNIDSYRMKLLVPGDSSLRAGAIIELFVPTDSVSQKQFEATTSGRWLVGSLKHIIRREAYSTVIELLKDSHDVDISKDIKEIQYGASKPTTGTASPS